MRDWLPERACFVSFWFTSQLLWHASTLLFCSVSCKSQIFVAVLIHAVYVQALADTLMITCVLSLITTHCVTEPGPNYRRSVGGAPELAESLLQTGQYVLRSAQDMWSFGMAMLEVLGGQRPLEHQLLLMSAQFKAEVQATGRSKAHLEYLARLLLDSVPYADQVLLPETLIKAATSNGFDHHILLECCQ